MKPDFHQAKGIPTLWTLHLIAVDLAHSKPSSTIRWPGVELALMIGTLTVTNDSSFAILPKARLAFHPIAR
jgi:hypothetical protein